MRCRLACHGGRRRARAHPHERQVRPVERWFRAAVEGDREGLGEHLEREQHAGAHGRVVGDGAGEPDGGERRRADDLEPGGRDPYGSIRRGAVGHGDVLTEVLVQRRHRGRAEDDLTRSVDAMATEDGRGNRRGDVLHEEGHALAVELHIVVRGAAVGGDVPVVPQQRERHLGDVATPRADGLKDVRPVPAVQRRPGDQCLQAVPERQCRHDECHGKNGAEQRGATGTALRPSPGSRAMRTPTTPGAERPARAADATTRAPDVDRMRGRSAMRCGAVEKARRAATALKSTTSTMTPRPRTVQSKEIPREGSTGRTGPSGASGDNATATAAARSDPTGSTPRSR